MITLNAPRVLKAAGRLSLPPPEPEPRPASPASARTQSGRTLPATALDPYDSCVPSCQAGLPETTG